MQFYKATMKKFTLTTILGILLALPLISWAEWQIIDHMPVPRHGMASAVLDGKIYLIGGKQSRKGANPPTSRVTAFDPVSGVWDTTIASLQDARSFAFSTAYGEQLYVFSGQDRNRPVQTVERYDPAENQWTVIDTLPHPRAASGGAMLGDSLYLVGGRSESGPLAQIDIYRFSDGQWLSGGPMTDALSSSVVLALQGQLYVMGGFENSPSDAVHIFDGEKWMEGPAMPIRVGHFAGAVRGRTIVIAGGNSFSGSTGECWILQDSVWTRGPDLQYPRAGLSMVNVNDILYTFGGIYNNSTVSEVESWDNTTSITGIAPSSLPDAVSIRNYPNPFNSRTTILVDLPAGLRVSDIRYEVYDATGRQISSRTQRYDGAGSYQWHFDARGFPEPLAGGIYFLRLRTGDQQATHKLIYLP